MSRNLHLQMLIIDNWATAEPLSGHCPGAENGTADATLLRSLSDIEGGLIEDNLMR